MANPIELGQWVSDRITGIGGIATGKAYYLTGSDEIRIEGQDNQGRPLVMWVDVQRVKTEVKMAVGLGDTSGE